MYNEKLCQEVREGKLAIENTDNKKVAKLLEFIFPNDKEEDSFSMMSVYNFFFADPSDNNYWTCLDKTELPTRPVSDFIESPTSTDTGQRINISRIAAEVAFKVRPELTAQEEAFFIAGFEECAKYFNLTPPSHTEEPDMVLSDGITTTEFYGAKTEELSREARDIEAYSGMFDNDPDNEPQPVTREGEIHKDFENYSTRPAAVNSGREGEVTAMQRKFVIGFKVMGNKQYCLYDDGTWELKQQP